MCYYFQPLIEQQSVTVVGMEKVPFERVLGLEVGTVMQKVIRKHSAYD